MTFYRRKLDANFNYGGIRTKATLAESHETAYIYVGDANRVEHFKGITINNGRDFDVLEESLGEVFF